jgi:hypothetical protein
MIWKRWNWLNDILLPLAMIILRLCWLWLWLALARRLLMPAYEGPLLPGWLIVGLLLGSLVATRLILRYAGTSLVARLGIAGLGLVVLLFVLWWQFYQPHYVWWDPHWLKIWGHSMLFWQGEPPPSYIVLPAVVYLWLRGILDGSRPLRHKDVTSGFLSGAVALVLFMIITRSDIQTPMGTSMAVFLFFAMAMLAMSLSSLELAPINLSGQENPFMLNRYWLGSMLTIIAGLLGLGLLLSIFIAPEAMTQLISWVWNAIGQALILLIKVTSLILYPVLYLLSIILTPLLRLIFDSATPQPIETPEDIRPDVPLDLQPDFMERVPDEWRWVGLVVFILVIGLVFALMVRRLMSREEDGVEETRESILSRDLLLAQLAKLWPMWLRQWRNQPAASINPFLSLAGEGHSRRFIRQTYQSLLSAAQERGRPRSRNQTPSEYAHALAQELPQGENALKNITKSYIQARYGSDPPTPEAVEHTRRAWEELRPAMQRQQEREA